MLQAKLELVTRSLGEHIVAIGHITSKDLRAPTFSAAEMQIVKVAGGFIDVTISKDLDVSFKDQYGDTLSKAEDMSFLPRLPIWCNPVRDVDSMLAGRCVMLDSLMTKAEMQSEALSRYNRCILTSVLKNSTDISPFGHEHNHWRTISVTESDYGYHFRMQGNPTNNQVHILHQKGEMLDDQLKGEALSGIFRTCMWHDLESEHFSMRWTICKEAIKTATEMRKHFVNGTEPSPELLAKAEEYVVSSFTKQAKNDEEYGNYIKSLFNTHPRIDMDEMDGYHPNAVMLRMLDTKGQMFIKNKE